MTPSRSFYGARDDHAYALAERRFREWDEASFVSAPQEVLDAFNELRAQIDADVESIKRRLFVPSLASRDDEKAAGRWISAQHRRLARIAHRMADTFARVSGVNEHAFASLAPALHYMGESVKGHIKETQFHRGAHALMRMAVASGRHHEPIWLEIGGRKAASTLTSLYFRALLLARLAGGELTFPQIEVVDGWMWNWMPALAGADDTPADTAFRADLDSNEGLRCGARSDPGPSLYLRRAPIEAVRLSLVKEFHAARTVPASGEGRPFPIDDHFAALDAVRRALRGVRHESAGRGRRYPATDVVELHVGLQEVMAEARAAPQRTRPPIALEPMAGEQPGTPHAPRERDHEGQVREPSRRIVQLIDVSDTGVSFEGDESDCCEIAVEDLVALRVAAGEPLLLASVARRLPAATGGRVVIGLRRLTSAAQPVSAAQLSSEGVLRKLSLLYVPGHDESGRNDSYLTDHETASERKLFETTVGEDTFTFRFNRVRERGRGWVMAGFEVTATRRPILKLAAREASDSHVYPSDIRSSR